MSSEPRRVGPWELHAKLGEGGNATVWSASRDAADAQPVALKVLNTTRAEREPYLRFRREVETLRRIGSVEGVLPLIDANLPSKPTTHDRAWLAMPIATPIVEALAGSSLESVVAAIGDVARR